MGYDIDFLKYRFFLSNSIAKECQGGSESASFLHKIECLGSLLEAESFQAHFVEVAKACGHWTYTRPC